MAVVRYLVGDVDPLVAKLKASGVPFRGAVVSGPGGRQALIEDPSGNPIELFESAES